MQLSEFGKGVGYFKGGIYGLAGSGKTWTSAIFAVGIRKFLKLKGPIAFFDTETGGEFVDRQIVHKETGQHIVGAKSRSLGDAIDFLKECEKLGVSVAIVDSTTHIWEEVQKTFLANINKNLVSAGRNPRTKIEWQDRGPLNDIWQKFTDLYLNSRLHIIICGRAANIWEMEVNEETGKKELNKVGTKMKTQSEMAYEPSFLAEMEREQRYEGGKQVIVRTMTVLKERFGILDGKQFENPNFDSIKAHVEMLVPGADNSIDTTRTTDVPANLEGDAEWQSEKKRRAIHSENLAALLMRHYPGQSAQEKLAKQEICFRLFGTRSWTEIENLQSEKLKAGIDGMDAAAKAYQAEHDAETKAEKTVDPKPAKAEKVKA